MNEKEGKRNGILSPCCSVTKRYRFPEFFIFSMKSHSSAFVLEDLFLARPRDATAIIDCNKSSGCIYGRPYM